MPRVVFMVAPPRIHAGVTYAVPLRNVFNFYTDDFRCSCSTRRHATICRVLLRRVKKDRNLSSPANGTYVIEIKKERSLEITLYI